jgi:hypothetical protein
MVKKPPFAFLLVIVAAIFIQPATASAADPTIGYFRVAPASVSYGAQLNLSWQINNNGAGASLLLTCPNGVTAKRASNGSAFPCNTPTFVSSADLYDISLYFANLTGSTQNIAAAIIPKDINNNDLPAGQKNLTFSVGPVPYPVDNFKISTSTLGSGSIQLNWTARETDGVNFIIGCGSAASFQTQAATTTNLPCGVSFLPTKQPANSPLNLNFYNNDYATTTVTFRILPAIAGEIYDGTNGQTATVDIPPKYLALPSINSFTGQNLTPLSNANVALAWKATKTASVNIQFICNQNSVLVNLVQGTTTSPINCNTLAFSGAGLPTIGSTTVSFTNSSSSIQPVVVKLMPALADGSYDGTKGASLTVSVFPIIVTAIPQTGTQTTPTAGPKTAVNAPVADDISTGFDFKKFTFSKPLSYGSRDNEVKALQLLFMKKPSRYPEVEATGYFGPATRRAVQIFQQLNRLAKPGDESYGIVGPKTRAALNIVKNSVK